MWFSPKWFASLFKGYVEMGLCMIMLSMTIQLEMNKMAAGQHTTMVTVHTKFPTFYSPTFYSPAPQEGRPHVCLETSH